MELTYNELRKRDVINVVDGKCLGKITDIKLHFPQGVLVGIFVPNRKNKGLFWFLDKSTLYIEVNKIVKIGGDVILVNLRCGDTCQPNSCISGKQKNDAHNKGNCNPTPPCPPPCKDTLDLSDVFNENGRIDLDDY